MTDQAFNLKLVTEVGKRPCLYNYTLPEYSRKDLTEQAWDDVGRAVHLSRSECKERWKNLRAVYVRHLRPGGCATGKPYYLADAMAFALPFVKTAHNAHSVITVKRKRAEDSDDDTLALADRPSPCSSPGSHAAVLPSPQPPTWKTPLEDKEDPLRTHDHDAREEANRMFLLSLLPDVNLMTPGQVRHFKRRAMEAVDDILEGSMK